MKAIAGYTSSCFRSAKSSILLSAAQNPNLALTLVIVTSSLILPLVSATALMPVVALFYVGDYLESKGLLSVLYTACFQGVVLAVILFALFYVAFILATGANIIHSKLFPAPKSKKEFNLKSGQQKNANFALF